jgi:hypothetical protein
LSEEEEKKLSRLEKRLVANVDFDDQVLDSLFWHGHLLYVGYLVWVQFSNGCQQTPTRSLPWKF